LIYRARQHRRAYLISRLRVPELAVDPVKKGFRHDLAPRAVGVQRPSVSPFTSINKRYVSIS
jgi:hypothetical protein